jgi:three-Cys-motif partner protein
MSELSSQLEGKLLANSVLPLWEEHHGAKHNILCEYSKAWMPILGQSYAQVAIVDGFASAGRYRNDRRGSPLVFLETYIDHRARDALRAPPHFIFIESNLKFAKHLQAEVDKLADLHNAEVDVIHGEYQDAFPKVVDYLARRYRGTVPTFTFVDPLGYENTPFALLRAYRKTLGDKSEAMVYVPIRHMARFAGTAGTEAAMDRAFDGREEWVAARDAEASGQDVGARLSEAYAEVMESEFDLVTRFVVDPISHNEYYLFFGTGHIKGLKVMKKAYWDTDPVGGTGYEQDPLLAAGQVSLLEEPDAKPALPPQERLEALIDGHFTGREFTIEDAEHFTLTKTRYRETHVREQALIPLQAKRRLHVIDSTRKSERHFPSGTRMRLDA